MYSISQTRTYLNILIYGNPGIGKTWLTATAQSHKDMQNVYFLNVEGGLATIAGVEGIKAIDIVGIERFKPTPEKPALLPNQSTLEDEFWKLAAKQGDYANINTVIIDSGTEIQTLNLEILSSEAMKKNKNRSQDELWIDDYGKSTAQLKRIFRWFRDLPMNVIITALPQQVYPKGEGKKTLEPVEVRPQFTEKLGVSVMGYMDMVWYIYSDSDQRYLLTQEHGVFKAKTRGIYFSEQLGTKVLLKNVNDPKSEGHDLSSIYELFKKTEIKK